MVVPRLSFNEHTGHIEQGHYAIKRPLSTTATQMMLDILESPKPLTSQEHSPEIRFNAHQRILALAE
ncbi:MAG: hypothetical protein LBL50_02185 [Candidatus Margulisbacteria bacterium]|jgi:hypothetical protein|nr:hypothetical protein [Candidatus Margulisiibacteriota bacterium]